MSARDRAAEVLAAHFVGISPRTHSQGCTCGWAGPSRFADALGARRDATTHLADALADAGLLADPATTEQLRDATVRLDEQRRMTARAEQYAEAASDSNRANADRAERAEARLRHLEALLNGGEA